MSKMVIEKYGENKAHYFSAGKDKPLFVIHALSPEEMIIIMAALNDYEKEVKRNTTTLEKFGSTLSEQQKEFQNTVTDISNRFTNEFSNYPEFIITELDY